MNLHISRTKFYLIVVLILLLPLLSKSRLLILGEITEAEVIDSKKVSRPSLRFHGSTDYSIVQFNTANEVITMTGPPNAKYDFGEKVKVIYLRNDPTNCSILSFSDIYFGLNAVLPAMLLIIWICLYLSLKEHAAQKHMSKS